MYGSDHNLFYFQTEYHKHASGFFNYPLLNKWQYHRFDIV